MNKLALTLPMRLLLLFCIFIVCYLVTAVASYVVSRLFAGNVAGAMRISAVVQDLICFIIPAVVTALLVTRRPAELLGLMRRPSALFLGAVAVLCAVSVPLQEFFIYWNYHLKLPEALSGFEQTARAIENSANAMMQTMMSNTSAGALIVNILIIGILAGLSEELLFRGCFQRLLTTGGVNAHLAIWIVAFCFSAMHFQLFGFVPRMLLGAYFGYLLLWSGSVWVPVAAHVLNNTIFVVVAWLQVRANGPEALAAEPESYPLWLTAVSAVLTAAILYILWKKRLEPRA